VATFVFVVVEGGIVWLAIRYRHRKGREGIPPLSRDHAAATAA
jgi:heme/copper-type cytochrome/quinol oxidase subunit 2